ncbi:MAG: DUF1570 domain-containing protein [Phycisphaerae bacterium]|nr:DUF1570 domain-containing protein [Phycisphaerae bacterium]
MRRSVRRTAWVWGASAALLAAGLLAGAGGQPSRPGGASASVIESAEPWDFNGVQGQLVRTKHYALYITERAPVIAERLPGFMEASLERYRTVLGPLRAPEGRMETYVMANRSQWQALTAQQMGERARTLLKIERGGFAVGGKAYLFDIGAVDTMSITAHEGWHQFTQRSFAEPMPVWLEEGIAAFMEGHRWTPKGWVFNGWMNLERFDTLRDASDKNELLGLEDLLNSAPDAMLGWNSQGAVMYYGQVWALVHFLREGEGGKHRAALEKLVSDAAEGRLSAFVLTQMGEKAASSLTAKRVGPMIFRAYFDRDLERAGREYRAFVKRLVGPGSRQAIVEGRSPLEQRTGR